MSDLTLREANPATPCWRCQGCGFWERRYERQNYPPACPNCSSTTYGHRKKTVVRMWPAMRVPPRKEEIQ